MHFPAAEECTFLQKNAVLGGQMAGNRRKLQEGFRAEESRALANFHKTLAPDKTHYLIEKWMEREGRRDGRERGGGLDETVWERGDLMRAPNVHQHKRLNGKAMLSVLEAS